MNGATWTGLALAVALAACGKAQEAASEKVVEKAIEAAASKDGTQAKVDLSGGSMKMTTTDASGKTSTVDIGGAKVTEADIGVPFYPGAKPTEGGSTRITTPDGTSATVALHSSDAVDKVASFYRDKLKAQSEGKQLMDMASDGNTTLMLADDKAKSSVQVHVVKGESGTDIQIMANRATAK